MSKTHYKKRSGRIACNMDGDLQVSENLADVTCKVCIRQHKRSHLIPRDCFPVTPRIHAYEGVWDCPCCGSENVQPTGYYDSSRCGCFATGLIVVESRHPLQLNTRQELLAELRHKAKND